jgi:hypothetical protein
LHGAAKVELDGRTGGVSEDVQSDLLTAVQELLGS